VVINIDSVKQNVWLKYADHQLSVRAQTDGHLEIPVIRRSRESGNPEKSRCWIPAYAGMTSFSSSPDVADAPASWADQQKKGIFIGGHLKKSSRADASFALAPPNAAIGVRSRFFEVPKSNSIKD
jgi:hypothetical protein